MIFLNQSSTLAQSITQHIAQNDAFALLQDLTKRMRYRKGKYAAQTMHELQTLLSQDKELCTKMAKLLVDWLRNLRLYPLFISVGIFSRNGFTSELMARLYEKFNPSHKDVCDLRDVFALLFFSANDCHWLEAVPPRDWLILFNLLRQHTSPHDRETVQSYIHKEGLHAVEMLSIWVAAEALEPDLMRLNKKLIDLDSPFVALKREVAHWIEAHTEQTEFDDRHLYVMLNQCQKQVEELRKKGTGAGAGSSMSVAHLLQRLQQTLDRMVVLLDIFSPKNLPPHRLLRLTGHLAYAAAEQHSMKRLWKSSVKMLSHSITLNTSNHGEHYIARNKKEYLDMFRSAAGGGALIALMSWFKIYLGEQIHNHFWLAVASGLNYGIGFMIIYMLGFTVATKQPAMTASHFATSVERNDKGAAVNKKLANLLVDVLRSQSVAVFGNVFVAMTLASIIAGWFWLVREEPILNTVQVAYQLKAIDPFKLALWYAAIAGVWLFCSGIISGFFDNRSDYLNLRMRLRHHPVLKIMLPESIRIKFANYIHHNYGSLMGNLCFGMLLGMTGFVGHATGLPLDIRHVAFSSANVGYAAVSGSLPFWQFLQALFFVLLIGGVNLWVSFSITLWVALRSRETRIDSWWEIARELRHIIKERPLSLFLPLQLPSEANTKKPNEIKKENITTNTTEAPNTSTTTDRHTAS